jgi:hypothetical protein
VDRRRIHVGDPISYGVGVSSGPEDALDRWKVREPRDADRQRWRELYSGYAEFYEVQQT